MPRYLSSASPSTFLSSVALLLVMACAAVRSPPPSSAATAPAAKASADVGFVIAAPDRGFLGDEEIRDAFATFAAGAHARLVFVTDERTRAELVAAVTELAGEGVQRVVVLPLFLTRAELGFQRLAAMVGQAGFARPVTLAPRFGESYLAVELLADRFRALPTPAGRRVVVLGYGAADAAAAQAMTTELQRIAAAAGAGFGFEAVRVVVWRDVGAQTQHRDPDAEAALVDAGAGPDLALVPFALGPKLDSMMSFSAGVLQHARGLAQVVDTDVTPDPMIAQWMQREANRQLPLTPDAIGVVFLAHGSDHHWNDGMERAAAALAKHYKVEFAFCMADPPLVERAVRRLEARGVRAIVVVRVFGLESSFAGEVKRMLGLDFEGSEAAAPAAHAGHDLHAMHAGHDLHAMHAAPAAHAGHDMGDMAMGGGPTPRVRSTAIFATVGGLEDSPLFADALLDRALAHSKNPARETIILVAHGSGDDATNEHWKHILEALAARLRAGKGAAFRAVLTGTWREDWPDKRAPEVAAIRALVEAADRDGGRAIVIPARTSAQGFETEFLEGLAFTLGEGFAPHPLFERWLEEQVSAGVALLRLPR